jgi:hypothetical protein
MSENLPTEYDRDEVVYKVQAAVMLRAEQLALIQEVRTRFIHLTFTTH